MNSNLTGRLALLGLLFYFGHLFVSAKGLTQHGARISLHVLADVANITQATQVLKQAGVSEVHL